MRRRCSCVAWAQGTAVLVEAGPVRELWLAVARVDAPGTVLCRFAWHRWSGELAAESGGGGFRVWLARALADRPAQIIEQLAVDADTRVAVERQVGSLREALARGGDLEAEAALAGIREMQARLERIEAHAYSEEERAGCRATWQRLYGAHAALAEEPEHVLALAERWMQGREAGDEPPAEWGARLGDDACDPRLQGAAHAAEGGVDVVQQV